MIGGRSIDDTDEGAYSLFVKKLTFTNETMSQKAQDWHEPRKQRLRKSTSRWKKTLGYQIFLLASSLNLASGQLSAPLPANGTFGDLLAVGAISREQQKHHFQTSARLVDKIASPAGNADASQVAFNFNSGQLKAGKLDYIVEFMRNNKLGKFCDLLTSQEPEIKLLNERLNGLNQFTLFVPSDEAISATFDDAKLAALKSQPEEVKRFLLAHATSELVVPKLNLANVRESIMAFHWHDSVNGLARNQQQASASSTSLIFTLAGNPLRVTTSAFQSQAAPNLNQAPANLTSQALNGEQSFELLNPKSTRLELIVNGANVISGQSYALQEPNNSSATYAIVHLIDKTLYPAPSVTLVEKIRSIAPQMSKYIEMSGKSSDILRALESTQTLASVFLPNDDAFKALPEELLQKLETNRTFLANFLLNHLVDGLYFSAQLAPASSPLELNKRPTKVRLTSLSNLELEFESKMLQSRTLLLVNSIPVLEADIMTLNGVIHLISRPLFEHPVELAGCQCNNSTATAALWPSSKVVVVAQSNQALRLNHQPQAVSEGDDRRQTIRKSTGSNWFSSSAKPKTTTAGDSNELELEREESSPKLRSQRSGNLPVGRNSRDFYRPSTAPANLNRVASEQSAFGAANQLLGETKSGEELFDENRYKIVLNATTRQRMREQLQKDALASSSAVLFAYDKPLVQSAANSSQPTSNLVNLRYSTLNATTTLNPVVNQTLTDQLLPAAANRQQRLLKFQLEDARDPLPGMRLNATSKFGKTKAPPGFTGCAFYDADCKRLVGKLVRLPAAQRAPSPTNQTLLLTAQHLDSTFGESVTERPAARPGHSRVSALNQPLPPWSDEERHIAQMQSNWRSQEGDIARINAANLQLAAGNKNESFARKTFGNRPQPLQIQLSNAPAQIILMPVPNANQFLSPSANLSQLSNSMFVSAPINRATAQQPNPFGSQLRFHTPTPYSVSPVTTHLPAMFNPSPQQQFGRLTNFTTIETVALEEPATRQQQQATLPLRTPSAIARKQQQQETNYDAIKQARKMVRIQAGLPAASSEKESAGDISITSARLNSSGLATQASNPAPNISANFVRSAPNLDPLASPSSEFFQNRTIAEIMDDSGLRIDGQQVTFNRLKECLSEAELLSLVTQTGSALTIFMPTDLAFQRLVQQQAAAYQQQQAAQEVSSLSSRLLNRRNNNLLPLVSTPPRVMSSRLVGVDTSSAPQESSQASLADRLTLDCLAPQVRQLLLDHLSAKLVTPKQLLADTSIGSLSGRQLLLSSVPSKKIVVVDGQPVVAATRAKNGMVYVVNKFLNLTQQVPNVMDLIQSQPNLTTFLSYLTFSSFADRLKRETGPLTILAPTNEAFEQLSSAGRQLINSDPAALMDILRGHVVEGAQFGKLISMRNQLKTMNTDQTIEAKVIKPNVYLLDNQMTSIKLIGTTGNGVVNSIDRLIVPGWLKVSMGNNPQPSSAPTALTFEEPSSSQPKLSALNLPSISEKPIRFEHSGNRLFPANNQSNSFLLTNNNVVEQGASSPFLRVASNLSGSGSGSGSDLNGSKNMAIIEKLAKLMQATGFLKYLTRSRVSEALKPDMNYVILVPTDQALEKLPRQIIDMLEKDPERLADLVNYHVLDTTFEYINTIPDGQTLNTLNEKDILFNWHRNNTILTASGAVVMGGIQEDNIALLIVDRVLYPTPGDLLNIVAKSPILSNFTSLIRNAGLEQQLSLAGPFTLFAPSDFAFNQLSRRDVDFLKRDKESARRFLLRHLSQPAIFTSSIALSNQLQSSQAQNQSQNQSKQVPTMTISNSLGEDLTLRQKNDYFSVNEVNFSYADVAATNGVVHVIDGLL